MGTRLAPVSETTKPGTTLPAPRTATGQRNRLLVIDGHSMAFRAFYALPPENFSTDTGQHTNAVYGFTAMLINLIKDQKPTHVAVAFDLDTPTFRSEEYTEYKAGRSRTPEEFHGQVDLIIKVMEAMRIPTISMDGYEADDILATLSTKAAAEDWDVQVVSGDRDAFQLVNDRVTVLYPKQGVTNIPQMDAQAIEEKYFVPPHQYSDLAALVGESADNLPGVPGVGPKTAAKWIKLYGGLEGILENLDSIGGKVGDALRAHADDVRRNRRLNRLLTDLDLPVDLDAMVSQHPDRSAVEDLFDSLQFNTLRKRLFDLFGEEEAEETGDEMTPPPHVVLTDAAPLTAWLTSTNQALAAVHLATEATAGGTDVTGIAIVTSTAAAYVPLEGLDAEAEQVLAHWLADLDAPKVVHDFKEAYKLLAPRGLHLAGEVDDTAISGYLIQPDRRSYDLADLSQYHLRLTLGTAPGNASGQLALELGEKDVAGPAVMRAFAALQLSEHFAGQLVEKGAKQLLGELELPLSEVLAEMELTGVAVSVERLDRLLDDFSKTISTAGAEAFRIIGKEINLGSPKQLQTVLFEELGLPKTKKIKTGYSTDADALTDLIVKTGHPFLEQLLAYRDATKLRQTVEGLRKSVAEDGRIHTTYAQTVAATGRLSSINPNLQNIPVRSDEGRRIREVFVVGKGTDGTRYETLMTADYSQIEMRIMAHLSGDEGLISAFREGEDLHRFVGSHIFGVAPEEVTSAMRSKVKAMSYGLVYGLSSFGLSKQLAISVDEARTLMRDYFERFGAVRDYLRGIVEQARKDGYTSTIEGRRRYLPDLSSDNRQLREMSERAALNAPIQGSAADIIKKAMLGVDSALKAKGLSSRMLLQVHDELVLEIAEGEKDVVEALVREQMAGAADLSVPLDVSVGTGLSWHEAAH
ncbi:DNA polymerase I [Arthrobacter sp. MSA 4-2]|uniref:DNA polymerase I n=1 Tax=Arthrobacter sp. MSA 4-2 TaxID=2794349 RepID=UPI0018E7671F|nr:DNA polymerase I [Arthrobacter sp. MSA 4-2]MBJ2121631.1 DNA polymerase I [Arthrobacter sp. MSA 4-2]